MSILPLPQFEKDLAEHLREKEDREAYAHLKPPTTMVVRFGVMRMVGEFPYDGESKPGCGSKIVVRTQRGTELGEMLTSTCENAGCTKSVSRKEMLEYIDNSGGHDYPFLDSRHNKYGVFGRALRIATAEDMAKHSVLGESGTTIRKRAQELSNSTGVNVKIVEAEQILGGEMLTVYYLSEERVDFGALLTALKAEYPDVKVELKQIGARDEARITADYERCGQYCCCKNFLKVLKPVSMRSAKVQKATLDPLKISGRCGRLMCCLRYEDKTYSDLKKNLPHRKTRVGTPHGDGIVLDSQILTQLVLVRLDEGKNVAVPVEELLKAGESPQPEAEAIETHTPVKARERKPREDKAPEGESDSTATPSKRKRRRRKKPSSETAKESGAESPAPSGENAPTIGRRRKPAGEQDNATGESQSKPKPKRRRRRSGSGQKPAGGDSTNQQGETKSHSAGESGDAQPAKKRRRRRRRSGGSGGSGGDGGSGPTGDGGSPSSGGGSSSDQG
jgi:cell fate regulator YaaT (PSP1 superfamily)